MTVLFNIKTIKIEGSSEYDASEIVKASQIYKGDNLVRLNTETARNRILTNLMYIDDVTIKKEFPSTLTIETVASIPAMNIQNGDNYTIISEGLKCLSDGTDPQDGLLCIKGFEPTLPDSDNKLTSEDEQKPKILSTIYSELKNVGMLADVVSVDMTDKYDIVINYADRIYVKLGAYSDLEYKIKYAYTVITQNINEQKSGYLIFINSNSASFVEKDKFEAYSEKIEEITDDDNTAETTTIPYIDTVSANETFDFNQYDTESDTVVDVETEAPTEYVLSQETQAVDNGLNTYGYETYNDYNYSNGDDVQIVYGTSLNNNE
jgi:cell division septal protein FtsQ